MDMRNAEMLRWRGTEVNHQQPPQGPGDRQLLRHCRATELSRASGEPRRLPSARPARHRAPHRIRRCGLPLRRRRCARRAAKSFLHVRRSARVCSRRHHRPHPAGFIQRLAAVDPVGVTSTPRRSPPRTKLRGTVRSAVVFATGTPKCNPEAACTSAARIPLPPAFPISKALVSVSSVAAPKSAAASPTSSGPVPAPTV